MKTAKQLAIRLINHVGKDVCRECKLPLDDDRFVVKLDDGALRFFCPDGDCFPKWLDKMKG